MDVETILATKGRQVATIGPEATVSSAVVQLRSKLIGALVVSSDGERVDGILSERDIVRGLSSHRGGVLDLRVAQLMTRAVETCSPKDTVKSIMASMTRHRVRHLPVVEDGRLCGLVSIGDVVKNRLDEVETEVNVLRDAYIAHRR
ncbi:CBS domain-containing protein [soil metagenome]|nr:CBS domain-containing protein [Acidimicrobiia bacterium]